VRRSNTAIKKSGVAKPFPYCLVQYSIDRDVNPESQIYSLISKSKDLTGGTLEL